MVGNSQAPEIVKRATDGLHVFVYMYLSSFIFVNSMPKPHRTNAFIIMKKMEFVKYDAPQVEVIEVEVEKGFAASPGDDNINMPGGNV